MDNVEERIRVILPKMHSSAREDTAALQKLCSFVKQLAKAPENAFEDGDPGYCVPLVRGISLIALEAAGRGALDPDSWVEVSSCIVSLLKLTSVRDFSVPLSYFNDMSSLLEAALKKNLEEDTSSRSEYGALDDILLFGSTYAFLEEHFRENGEVENDSQGNVVAGCLFHLGSRECDCTQPLALKRGSLAGMIAFSLHMIRSLFLSFKFLKSSLATQSLWYFVHDAYLYSLLECFPGAHEELLRLITIVEGVSYFPHAISEALCWRMWQMMQETAKRIEESSSSSLMVDAFLSLLKHTGPNFRNQFLIVCMDRYVDIYRETEHTPELQEAFLRILSRLISLLKYTPLMSELVFNVFAHNSDRKHQRLFATMFSEIFSKMPADNRRSSLQRFTSDMKVAMRDESLSTAAKSRACEILVLSLASPKFPDSSDSRRVLTDMVECMDGEPFIQEFKNGLLPASTASGTGFDDTFDRKTSITGKESVGDRNDLLRATTSIISLLRTISGLVDIALLLPLVDLFYGAFSLAFRSSHAGTDNERCYVLSGIVLEDLAMFQEFIEVIGNLSIHTLAIWKRRFRFREVSLLYIFDRIISAPDISEDHDVVTSNRLKKSIFRNLPIIVKHFAETLKEKEGEHIKDFCTTFLHLLLPKFEEALFGERISGSSHYEHSEYAARALTEITMIYARLGSGEAGGGSGGRGRKRRRDNAYIDVLSQIIQEQHERWIPRYFSQNGQNNMEEGHLMYMALVLPETLKSLLLLSNPFYVDETSSLLKTISRHVLCSSAGASSARGLGFLVEFIQKVFTEHEECIEQLISAFCDPEGNTFAAQSTDEVSSSIPISPPQYRGQGPEKSVLLEYVRDLEFVKYAREFVPHQDVRRPAALALVVVVEYFFSRVSRVQGEDSLSQQSALLSLIGRLPMSGQDALLDVGTENPFYVAIKTVQLYLLYISHSYDAMNQQARLLFPLCFREIRRIALCGIGGEPGPRKRQKFRFPSEKEFFRQFRSSFYPLLFKLGLSNKNFLSLVCQKLLDIGVEEFIEEALPYVLPIHISVGDMGALMKVERIYGLDMKFCLVKYSDDIFTYILTHIHEREHLEASLAMIYECVGRNPLFLWKISSLFYILVNELGDSDDRVSEKAERCLVKFILMREAEESNEGGGSGDISGEEKMGWKSAVKQMGGFEDAHVGAEERTVIDAYMRSKFLGIMDNNFKALLMPNSFIEEKRHALRAFEEVLKLSRFVLRFFRPKVLSVLDIVLRDPEMTGPCLNTLYVFLQLLTQVHWGQILFHCIIITVQYIDDFPDQTLEILKLLIPLNVVSSSMSEYLEELYILFEVLPDHEILARFKEELKSRFGEKILAKRLEVLISQIELLSSSQIVLAMLKALRALLVANHQELISFVISNTASAPGHPDSVVASGSGLSNDLIRRTIGVLLSTLRTSVNADVQLKCAECLGELGAIDPARLMGLRVVKTQSNSAIRGGADFRLELVAKHLVNALSKVESAEQQDMVGYSVQEVLKVIRGNIWEEIPKEAKENLEPYLSSRYMTRDDTEKSTLLSKPVLDPSKSIFSQLSASDELSVQRWLTSWEFQMIERCRGASRALFKECEILINIDRPIALFLLPHIVLSVIKSGSDKDIALISREMLSVLDHVSAVVSRQNTYFMGVSHGGATPLHSQQGSQAIQTKRTSMMPGDTAEEGLTISKAEIQMVEIVLVLYDMLKKHITVTAAISDVVNAIPHISLAKTALGIRSYARALFHLEYDIRQRRQFVKGPNGKQVEDSEDITTNEDVRLLQRLYRETNNPDGMESVEFLKKRGGEKSQYDQIVNFEVTGQWMSALSCYDQACQSEPNNLANHLGMLNCLKHLGMTDSMVVYVNGLLSNSQFYEGAGVSAAINSYKVQVAWRLGLWEDLAFVFNDSSATVKDKESELDIHASFESSLANLLFALYNGDRKRAKAAILQSRERLTTPLSISSLESYDAAYPFIQQLALLREAEIIVDGEVSKLARWRDILEVGKDSDFEFQEQFLNFRRQLLNISGREGGDGRESEMWVAINKVARKAGLYQSAYSALVHASPEHLEAPHLESAKLMRAQGNVTHALHTLGNALRMHAEAVPEDSGTQKRRMSTRMYAKTALLYGRWLEETGQKNAEELMGIYKDVTRIEPQWDKGYFYLGRYYDSVYLARIKQPTEMDNFSHKPQTTSESPYTYLPLIITNYGNALRYSRRYLYTALPRLLTLWFDFGKKNAGLKKPISKVDAAEQEKVMENINEQIRAFIKDLPLQTWVFVLGQLTSRILHKRRDVYQILEELLVKLLVSFPHHTLWYLAGALCSTRHETSARAAHIRQVAQAMNRRLGPIFTQFIALANNMIFFCRSDLKSKVTRREHTLDMKNNFKELYRMAPLDKVMLPLLSAVTTPPKYTFAMPEYGQMIVTIAEFGDQIKVFRSLCLPRRISVVGSDGKRYYFLAKPKDDLRKDQRLMEFCTLINSLFRKNSQARRKSLHIRTFGAFPLNEEVGLIEWVPNTKPFRSILKEIFDEGVDFIPLKDSEIAAIFDNKSILPIERYRKRILPRFKPIFYRWFINKFVGPSNWLTARTNYAHTLAVMSIVGYILGLGDRHTENLLFDETSGEIVHVDFSCIFFKGLRLRHPERVPFRLTQNIVDALGITGVEGPFRAVCELTYDILQQNIDPLTSVLETFVYDPLLEWSREHKRASSMETLALRGVELRLRGIVDENIPQSVQGIAHYLIEEAMNHENLSQMYIGWKAWL